ncbi:MULTISPECIES: hypothetical protein [Sphingobacterium]|uniref:SsrA-binding protein n=1 Tax=Sphingobacterium populi TaxID=1812824 RepID=A0ABW5UDL9_9SPHI|nr:hypothetical protein [Sphingobacterium sp. CFCC 11742]
MKKLFFGFLNRLNKAVLPSYSQLDPARLTKLQQAIVAFRYYVLIQSKD